MAADPLKEVLLKVVQERRQQIETLSVQLNATADPIARTELENQIQQLQREQVAAQNALGQSLQAEQPSQPQPQPQAPAPHERDTGQLLGQPAEPKAAPKGPTKAALEAQIRELQKQLLDSATEVKRSGLSPNPAEVKLLEETKSKLQVAMRQIAEADIAAAGELPPPPSPSQLAEADNLVRRSALEKRRGNKQLSTDLLRKAAEVAPGAPSVQEALGDDLMERGQAKPASETYAKALAMSPGNASLERKYAAAISRIQAPISFEQAMQMADKPLNAADAATVRAAAIFSFFIPGIGQFVLGDYGKGAFFLVTWLAMVVWLAVVPNQWRELLSTIAGRSANFHPIIVIPIISVLALAIGSAWSCKGAGGISAGSMRKKKGDHPLPPVDLPFE